MISHIIDRSNLFNVINIAILIIGLIHRIYGWDSIGQNLVKLGLNIFVSMIMIPLFIYINQALIYQSSKSSCQVY